MAESRITRANQGDKAADWRWLLAALGLGAFHLSYLLAGGEEGVWLPAVGIGIALVAWLGYWVLTLLAFDAALIGLLLAPHGGLSRVLLESAFLTGQIGLVWWTYTRMAKGSRQLDDPRSATVFLILGPGIVEASFAVLQAGAWKLLGFSDEEFATLAGGLWISRAQGTLTLVPALMVTITPWLVQHQVVAAEKAGRFAGGGTPQDWALGEAVETGGLALGNGILAAVLAITQKELGPTWALWGFALLLTVWASLRQGLRGGALVAGVGAGTALTVATSMGVGKDLLSPLQGNLLAQCSTALLVGASAGWIRASEARYRQVVGHIPVVLYSAHLRRGLKVPTRKGDRPSKIDRSDPDLATGPAIIEQAEITLVSPASKEVFGCPPEEMLGPYRAWLERILPADRELVLAAVTQLCLQKQPVPCEYRLDPLTAKPAGDKPSSWSSLESYRWVRDTMAPFFTSENLLGGWEGVVEDITEQQALGLRLRRTSNMLQALISNLPTGVFFVQGPMGQPILVNARARQLLGQREDLAAGIMHLSQVYRLHRPDGTLYPTDDLPVARALRQGMTSSANDIVVHHADGRRIPLITWAAPVELGGNGKADAAVWVLEDMSALQQAELARRESESRLRAVIETMAEGLLIQNQAGIILDCNPAAAGILGIPSEALLGQAALAPAGCLREDGSIFPRDQQPDLLTLSSGQPVRNVILGFPLRNLVPRSNGTPAPGFRWILVNSMPLPGHSNGSQGRAARIVTTFADVTEHRQALEVLRLAKEKYQSLVETLPLMVLQFDAGSQITFLNPATERITGWSAARLLQPGFWSSTIQDDDRSQFDTSLARTLAGYHARIEFRYQASDGATKVGLALMQPLLQDGRIQGTTCLVVDMTLQRTLEAELQRAQQLELVGRLAGGTVHDFNNLLTVMVGLAQLADHTTDPAHPAHDHLQQLIEAGEQASHLAGQILAFSKQRRHAPGLVPLHAIVLHSLHMLRSVLRSNIRIETVLGPEEIHVRCDEHQLKQVIMNLCLNARDAMPAGGKLRIRTEVVADTDAAVANATSQPCVRLSIEDSGQGMDEATLKRIFEPFFSTKERGTGLGLAVVRQIVESFGGHIKVSSQPEMGTRMEVYLRL